MNPKDRSRLMFAGGASIGLNLLVWLAVSQGFARSEPAIELPPAEISRVSVDGDGQVVPQVVGPGTGMATKEIAGVPMSLPAAEELKRLANMPQVPPLGQSRASNRNESEQTRREVERTLRDFGYKSRTYEDSNSGGNSYPEPEIEISTNPPSQPSSYSPPQAQAPSGAKVSESPNSAAIPVTFGEAYLPDHLKRKPHSNSVKVRFEIDSSGNAQVHLESSTGVPEIDSIVLTSLKLWKWRPAYKDGQPYASTVNWVYTFPT